MVDRTSSETRARARKRLLTLTITACLVLSVSAVALIGRAVREPERMGVADSTPAPPDNTLPTEVLPAGIDAEASEVAAALRAATATWASHIASVEVLTILHRPVVLVTTDIESEQADVSEAFSSAVAAFVGALRGPGGSPYTYQIQMVSTEGDVIGWLASTDERWELDALEPPSDATELRTWLDTVYGPGSAQPEPWMGRITSIDGGVSADGYVVLRTDLDPTAYKDQPVAQTIIDAVRASGATFAPGVRVLFSDGQFEWSSLIAGTPPVSQ